jgi:hypothetical protein
MQASLKKRMSASPMGAPDPILAPTRLQRWDAASGDGAPSPAKGGAVPASC